MKTNYKINAPLLYRLIDEEPHLEREKGVRKAISLSNFYDQIRQNLENILNTRLDHFKWEEGLLEVDQSILNYGVGDFTLNYFGNKNAQIKLCQRIKEAICRFEPRIQSVQVVPVENELELGRILKIRIECEVDLKPSPVPAIFESALDISKQTFHVE